MEDTFPCERKASLSWGKATLPDGIFSEKYEEFYSVDYESQMAVNLNIPHELLNEPVGKNLAFPSQLCKYISRL